MKANPTVNPSEKDASTSSGLLDALLETGHERQRIMQSLHEALLGVDDAAALDHARELIGLPSQESPVSAVGT